MASNKQTGLWIAIAVLALAAVGGFVAYSQKASELAKVKTSEQDVQARYGQTIQAIAEIQDSLNTIADDNPNFGSGSAEAERDMSGPNREAALDRISQLRTSISRSKERINALEADLKKRGVENSGLQKLIANLRRSVADREAQVTMLASRVDSLQTEVTGLNVAVAETKEKLHDSEVQVEDKRRELATVYYVVGDKDALAESGIVQTKGGVLGLGKTVVPAGSVDRSAFTPLDTDEQTVIVVPAKKAKVVSAQPQTSYELRAVNGQMELHILDPEAFRKIREVIILTS
jgi:hypothetical protein